MSNRTICAVSTPNGQGGIAVIRISGPDAISVCNKIYQPVKKSQLFLNQEAYTTSFGKICNGNHMIDQVLVTVFRAPHSYTGEDTVEISCHGSLYIQQEILRCLAEAGCYTAAPGEFTQRAFLNGKMDLSQAEAVADVIASSNEAAHRVAMQQLRGGFGRELKGLRNKLLHFSSLVELELDFSEEDVTFADREDLVELIDHIETAVRRLADSFIAGNALKNGIPVAIAGETNVGKSTLLNQLLKDEKAIVSDIHGTTRDVIEDTILLDGRLFRFIDTAGIRETTDSIEKLGIERTYRKIEQASIILWMIDLSVEENNPEELIRHISDLAYGKKVMMVFNKSDKLSAGKLMLKEQVLKQLDLPYVIISAKNEKDILLLESLLSEIAGNLFSGEDGTVITSSRHYEALNRALKATERIKQGLEEMLPGDLLSMDIRECIRYIGEITGEEITDKEILENIFKNFCIGK